MFKINKILKILYIAPEYFIVLTNLVFIFLNFKFSYPLIFILLLIFAVNLVMRIEKNALFLPVTFPLVFGLLALLSHILARTHLHGTIMTNLIFIFLLSCSIWVISWKKMELSVSLKEAVATASPQNLLINLSLLVICAVYWYHSLVFWYFTHDNSPAADFIQTGYYILKRGYFNFPDLSVAGNCWYPNLYSHLIAISAPFMGWENLMRYAAVLGTFFSLWGLSLIYLIFQEKGQFKKEVTFLILALLCSYSFFKIIPEFSSDTLVFIFIPAFYYLLLKFIEHKKFIFFYLAFATACFSFWFRTNVGLSLLAAAVIFIFIYHKIFLRLFIHKSALKLCLLFLTLLGGMYWQWEVFRLAGNPSYPYSGRSILLSVNNKNMLQEILYHFFAVNVFNTSMVKAIRGILHGFTYSTFLTMASFAGIIVYYLRRSTESLRVQARISLALIMTVFLLMILGGYHYKFLYVIFLSVITFSLISVSKITQRYPNLNNLAIIIFLGIFVTSYLMTGFGHTTKKWAIAEYIFESKKENISEIKYFAHYRTSQTIKHLIGTQDKILYFHIEPGFQIGYYLNLHPPCEELNYSDNIVKEIYCMRKEEDILRWLRGHNIKVIVFSYTPEVESYRKIASKDCPQLLPSMLINKSKYFFWAADDVVIVPAEQKNR